MAEKTVTWSLTAEEERYSILRYWIDHNKSTRFSDRLNTLIEKTETFIATHPNSGRPLRGTKFRSIRIIDYLLFFEETTNDIFIVSFWDGRQDPEKLTKRLE